MYLRTFKGPTDQGGPLDPFSDSPELRSTALLRRSLVPAAGLGWNRWVLGCRADGAGFVVHHQPGRIIRDEWGTNRVAVVRNVCVLVRFAILQTTIFTDL